MITEERTPSLVEQRLEEIEFYTFMRRLLDKYDRNIIVFDLVDVFSNFGNVVPALIKRLVQQVYLKDMSFAPSKEEMLIAYNKLGKSMREIKNITGIHPNTQYRLLEKMKQDRTQRPTLNARLDKETYLSMKSFMEQVNKFKEI